MVANRWAILVECGQSCWPIVRLFHLCLDSFLLPKDTSKHEGAAYFHTQCYDLQWNVCTSVGQESNQSTRSILLHWMCMQCVVYDWNHHPIDLCSKQGTIRFRYYIILLLLVNFQWCLMVLPWFFSAIICNQ